jgi:hypothetical protein
MHLIIHEVGVIAGGYTDEVPVDETLDAGTVPFQLCTGPDGNLYFPGGSGEMVVTQNGTDFTMTCPATGTTSPLVFQGTISNDTISGTINMQMTVSGGAEFTGTVTVSGTFYLTRTSEAFNPPTIPFPTPTVPLPTF